MPRSTLRLGAALATLGLLVPAGFAIGHSFGPNTLHQCQGQQTHDSRSGVIRQDVTFGVQDQRLYTSIYAEQTPTATGVPTVSALWTESNGLDWLQKENYLCTSPTHETAQAMPHPDTRLL